MDDSASAAPTDLIEVGEAGDTLRLWRAREAVRHGEIRLATQAAALAGMQTRSTSVLTWAVAGVVALGAGATSVDWRIPAATTAGVLFTAGILCVVALWPREWTEPGFDPASLIHDSATNELTILEGMALGYADGIQRNNAALRRFANLLRAAWGLLMAAPLFGGAALLISRIAA